MGVTDTPTLPSPPVKPSTGSDLLWHLFFGGLLFVTLVIFTFWATEEIGTSRHYAILIVTILFGVFMAFNIGGNDVANSFGTSVGAGTLTMKQALLVAAVFEVGGATLAGGSVTETVRSGIVDLEGAGMSPMDFAYIMIAALVGAAVWLLIATKFGMPVSTTHSIVGGICGAAVTMGFLSRTVENPWSMVQWGGIGTIVISWFLSPLLGGIVAYTLFSMVKAKILRYNEDADEKLREIREKRIEHNQRHRAAFERLSEIQQVAYTNAMAHDAVTMSTPHFTEDDLESEYYKELYRLNRQADDINAHRALNRWVPLFAAGGAMVIAAMMLYKGLKNLGLQLSDYANVVIIVMVGVIAWLVTTVFSRQMGNRTLDKSTFILFSWMQVFTASVFAFSHGSNDIANAVGPFAAVLDVLKTDSINGKAAISSPVMITMGIALVAGLWFIGRSVIHTVGSGLTEIHPASGFSAELSAATVVLAASLLGLPVSSTHILIGAVLGVGLVNRAANWSLMKPIALAWGITVPVAALIGAVTVVIVRAVFGV